MIEISGVMEEGNWTGWVAIVKRGAEECWVTADNRI